MGNLVVLKDDDIEKQTADWQQARIESKQAHHDLTDIIHTKLMPLAKKQGSTNTGKLYMIYSKLINSVLGIGTGQRNNLSLAYMNAVRFLEYSICNIIFAEVEKETFYKTIYNMCKKKCQAIKELSYLPSLDKIA